MLNSALSAPTSNNQQHKFKIGDNVFLYVTESDGMKGFDVGLGEVIEVDSDKVKITWLADIYRKNWFCTSSWASIDNKLRFRLLQESDEHLVLFTKQLNEQLIAGIRQA